MAVVDKYVNANAEAGKLANSAFISGAKTLKMMVVFETVAADSDTSVLRIAKGLDSSLIITDAKIYNDALTNATDWNMGLYDTESGAVVDDNVFLDAEDISAGNARSSPVDGLSNMAIENSGYTLYEHAGATNATKKPRYDIAFTCPTIGTTAATVVVMLEFIQG